MQICSGTQEGMLMRNRSFFSLKYLLLVYLGITVVLPIVTLFSTIRPENVGEVLNSVQFLPMLKNSVVTTVLATIISVLLSFGLAFALNRSNIRFKALFVVLVQSLSLQNTML